MNAYDILCACIFKAEGQAKRSYRGCLGTGDGSTGRGVGPFCILTGVGATQVFIFANVYRARHCMKFHLIKEKA